MKDIKFFIIGIVIIVIIRIVVTILKKTAGSGLQEKIKNFLANLENPNSSEDVVIYDENGQVMNFRNNDFENNDSQDVIIYDENGMVISPKTSPPPVYEPAKRSEVTRTVIVEEVESEEPEAVADAEMYHDFIRSSGGSAIVIQEILGKPLALRHVK